MRGDARSEIPNLITEGRGKRLLLVVAAAVVVVGGALGAFLYFGARKDAEQKRRAGQAWSAFDKCMLGAPLRSGESAAARQRAVELGRWHTPVGAIAEAQRTNPWPKRCLPYAQELYDAIAKSGAKGGSALGNLMRGAYGAMGLLKDGKVLPNVDEIWGIAADAKLPRFDAKGVPEPPAPATALLGKDRMASIGTRATLPWIAPGARRLHVIVERDGEGDKRETLVCFVPDAAPSPAFGKLVCRRLPANPGIYRTLETDDLEPTLINLDGVGGGILDLAGQPVWQSGDRRLLGGHAKGAHFASLVQVPPKNDFVLVSGTAGAIVETPLAIPKTATVVQQSGDWILWVQPGDDQRMHLFARRITHADPPLGPAIDAGAFGGSSDSGTIRDACYTPERLFVVAEPWGSEPMLTSVTGDAFAPMVETKDVPGRPVEQSCFGDAMIYTAERDEVRQTRCASAGCGSASSSGDGIASQAQLLGLQDRVLALWPAEDARNQERGSVWMRLAPIAELANVADVMIVDGPGGANGISGVLDGIWVWNGVALELIADAEDDASYLLRIDAGGAVTPIALEIR